MPVARFEVCGDGVVEVQGRGLLGDAVPLCASGNAIAVSLELELDV